MVADKTKSDFPSIITDGWTSCAIDFYMSFTLLYINDACALVTLMLTYLKKLEMTTEKYTIGSIEGFGNDYDLKGGVVAGIMDYELSQVKAGHSLTNKGVFQHVGCTNHRLESTTGPVFNGSRIKKYVTLAALGYFDTPSRPMQSTSLRSTERYLVPPLLR